jgi:uncharacterized membrane protein
MTWLQRYRLRNFVASSVWLPPLLGMVAALLLFPVIRRVDAMLGVEPWLGPDGARTLLGALASSMLTFIVFVFSILLLSVQLASAQLTPRIIALVYRSRVVKLSLTFFVFAFTYTLAVVSRIEDAVPQVSVWVAVYSSVICIGVFIYLIDNVVKSLRPVSILTSVGSAGQAVIREVYPRLLAESPDGVAGASPLADEEPTRTIVSDRTGAVLAFDVAGLVEEARRADCVIELVPQVGDFVTRGDDLYRLYHGAVAVDDRGLREAIAIGPERTLPQDPAFAFRIVVDIASKALSPAINDPTTAVLCLDQIQRLLRTVAERHLDTGAVRDAAGRLRLVYRTPDWEDFINLSVTEIRQFGRESIQIARRLRAMLENLIRFTPPERAALLRAELELLGRGVERDFRDPEDRARAAAADSLGVGGAAWGRPNGPGKG